MRGQALVELAVVAVPLLLLLLGIVQFAFIYNAQIGLTNAVRDTARYGSTLTANTNTSAAAAAASTYTFLTTSVGKYVSPYYSSNLESGTQACFAPYTDATGVQAVRVTVTAAYGHPLLIPLIGAIIDQIDGVGDGRLKLTSTIELRVDNPADPAPNVTAAVCNP